jgi:D-sedoheptulose 7-phosphate isomerase
MNKIKEYFESISQHANQCTYTNRLGNILNADELLKLILFKLNEIKTSKGTLYFIGNGASASISSHYALDFFKTGKVKTRTFNDLSYLTAISNDISFNEVFSFPLDELGTSEDILFAISSSGNSQNIVNGVDIAIKKGMFVVTFSGMSENNKIRSMGDINIYFPGQDYGPIECAHSIIMHCILDHLCLESSS